MPGIGAAREGCKIVAGGRRPPEKRSTRVGTLKGCQTSSESQNVAPLQGANGIDRYRRSPLRFDLRLLSGNPVGCKEAAATLKARLAESNMLTPLGEGRGEGLYRASK